MMRFIRVAVLIGCLCAASGAQVCNTASTLKAGRFSLGIAPVFYVDHGNDMGLYLNGGFGLTRSVDLSLKMILNDPYNYFGGDFEFVILHGKPTISLAAGMHSASSVLGIDGTFNLSFPIHRIISLYGGIDVDVNFHDDATTFPMWGFIGFQAAIRRAMTFFMEIDLNLNDEASDLFAIGLNVFF